MVFQQQIVNKEGSKIYLIASIALILMFYGVSVGINLTGFALFLNQEGFTKIQIGNILAMELAGNLMIAPILPKLSESFGIIKIMVVALITRSICLMMFANSGALQEYMLWLFGFGVSGFCLFASVQYWGTSIAKGSNQSAIISIFNVAFGLGIACGIVLLLFHNDEISVDLFYISVVFSLVIILPVMIFRRYAPIHDVQKTHVAPSKIIQYSQIPILCGLTANFILIALGNFVALYAIEHGVAYKDAIMINMYMIAGNILFTIPVGVLLDKFNKTGTLVAVLLVGIGAVASIPFVIHSHILTIITFLMISAATGGIYVTGLAMLTGKFREQNLAMANTIMLMMNAIGGFAGVSATGAAIQFWGNEGMVISVGVLMFFFLLFVIYSLNNRR